MRHRHKYKRIGFRCLNFQYHYYTSDPWRGAIYFEALGFGLSYIISLRKFEKYPANPKGW